MFSLFSINKEKIESIFNISNDKFSIISIYKQQIKPIFKFNKEEFSLISINKEKAKPIFNINKNEFSLISIIKEKNKPIFNINKETFSLNVNNKEKITPIFNINQNNFSLISIKKERIKENKIYQNKDFTFEIIPNEKEILDEKITTFHSKSKSRNTNLLNNSEISFKQETPLNSLDSNRSLQNQFSESKTLLSEIISFSIINKEKNTEKIIIEKPNNLKNKFDINLIKPDNNFNIQLSFLKLKSNPFEKIKPLITSYEIKEKDLSILSISNEKELTTSRDESKENTKDITQISKDIKNYDDSEMKRSVSKLKKQKENEINELIPSFNKDISDNDDNENDKTISKDKSIDTINKGDNKQENSYIGFQLDEPAQQLPLNNNNENIENNNYESYDNENNGNTTFDMKDDTINSPVFHHNNNLENNILISKKFNDLILDDYIPDKNNEKSFEDFHIEKDINNHIITNFSLELISEKNDLNNESELIENIENEHKLIDSIFTHNFFKKDKKKEINNRKGKKNILLKSILPIKITQIIKQNYKRNGFYDLINKIPLFIRKEIIKKLVINRLNKNKKLNLEKWKNKYLNLKIKEELVKNIKIDSEKNIIYQNGENFMIKGNEKEIKIIETKNEEKTQKKSKLINQELEIQYNLNSLSIVSKRENNENNKENEEEIKEEKIKDNKKENNKKNKKKKIIKKQNKHEEKDIKEEKKDIKEEKKDENEEKKEELDDKIIIRSKIIIKSKLNLIQKFKLRSSFIKWKINIEPKTKIQKQSFFTYLPSYTRIFNPNLLLIKHNFEYQINSILKRKTNISIINSEEKSKTYSNISQEFLSDFQIKKSLSQNFQNKSIIRKKDKAVQSSPSLDVNLLDKNNYKNIIQTLPSLDEEVFIPNKFNTYNVHNYETNEIPNLQRNYSFNPNHNNLLISTHLQISYLPNLVNSSTSDNKKESLNLNIKESKTSNLNNNIYSSNNNYEQYDYNIPSNEQNDDFIIDSIDSGNLKKDKEIIFDNETKNSEVIQIIEPLDEEIVENEKRKNINSQNIDDEIYVNVKINKKDNSDIIKKTIINILNRSNLKENDTKNQLKNNFKKWKKYTNPFTKSLISIKSLKLSKKKKMSNPNPSCLIKDNLNLKKNDIEIENIIPEVKEIIPRIRINEKIRLLVSIKHKAKILFNKWKKHSGITNQNKPKKSKINLILLAKEIQRKRCRSDNFTVLYKQKSNLLYSNILKGHIKSYFNKIFNQYIKNIIPKMKKLIILYKKIPLFINLVQSNLIKYSFRNIIKKSYIDNEKYTKFYKKLNNKKVLPTLENISALFIQNNYKKYSNNKQKKEKLFNLLNKIDNLDEDSFYSLIYLCKWYYKVKLRKDKKIKAYNYLKSLFKRLKNKIIVNTLFRLTEKYADYISLNIFMETIKNCFFRKIFNYIRLKFLLDKLLSDDNEQFKKKYLRSKSIKKWNNKCKIMRRRKNALMKMKKILKSHFVKSLINYSKLKKLKLILITVSLVKKGNNNNK